jgi:hypothetical protein
MRSRAFYLFAIFQIAAREQRPGRLVDEAAGPAIGRVAAGADQPRGRRPQRINWARGAAFLRRFFSWAHDVRYAATCVSYETVIGGHHLRTETERIGVAPGMEPTSVDREHEKQHH